MYEALFYFIIVHLKLSIIFEIIFVRNFLVEVPNLILNELSECFLFNFRNGVPIIELRDEPPRDTHHLQKSPMVDEWMEIAFPRYLFSRPVPRTTLAPYTAGPSLFPAKRQRRFPRQANFGSIIGNHL